VHLYEAKDSEGAYAVSLADDLPGRWRFVKGLGQEFQKVWSVELDGEPMPDPLQVDWEPVLDRALEAYQLSDPVIYNYQWPVTTAG
jgi:hypothetical protein